MESSAGEVVVSEVTGLAESSLNEAFSSSSKSPLSKQESSSQAERARKRGDWVALLERQRASGLSISAFCRREQIAAATFFYWKRRLAPEMRSAPELESALEMQSVSERRSSPERRPAERSDTKPALPAMLFSELAVASPPALRPGGVEIVTSGGWVVRADAGADAAWVARLLRALEGKGERPC